MRAVVRQPHMEDFRLETEQVLAQLQNAIDGFRPRDEHLLADVMLFGYCRDAADALRALLILSPSDATRSAYLPARAAFEAAQDALLLIADPDRFDANGALAYAIELVETQELQDRWIAAGKDWEVPPPVEDFHTPEQIVEEEVRAIDAVAPGMGAHLNQAFAEAREPGRAKRHWSGRSRKQISEQIQELLGAKAGVASTADAFYGMLSVQSHPRLRAWAQPVRKNESGTLAAKASPVHETFTVALGFVAGKMALLALKLRAPNR